MPLGGVVVLAIWFLCFSVLRLRDVGYEGVILLWCFLGVVDSFMIIRYDESFRGI